MYTKDDLHRLIDQLPDNELLPAMRYLEYLRNMGDPVLKALIDAPEDDEPETDEERIAVTEAYDDLAEGKVVTLDDVRRGFGA
jgi:hypothetical protein